MSAPRRPQLTVTAVGGRPGLDRGLDRRLAFAGVAVAAALLALALASLALPPGARLGTWLPLHLALAGAASTAIAAMLPFFTAALAVAPPADARLRVASLLLVPGSALAVVLGRVVGHPAISALGGGGFALGMVAVAVSAAQPLRGALGPRRRMVEGAYALAILEVALGASLAALFLGGEPDIVGRWAWLKPAHAWLNLLGFVTLVIAATLIHLAPTVVGSRIRPRPSGRLALVLLGGGPPIVALGYALDLAPLAAAGALVTVAGAAALVRHGIGVKRDGFAWTSDPDWHAFAEWSLLAGPSWLLVAVAVAAAGVVAGGASPSGWQLPPVLGPLVAGFVVQVLVGAWTHLVPAIGPGDPVQHGRQRRILGSLARPRLLAWNVAVAALTIGLGAPADAADRIGWLVPAAILVLAALQAGATALLAQAVLTGRGPGSPRPGAGGGG